MEWLLSKAAGNARTAGLGNVSVEGIERAATRIAESYIAGLPQERAEVVTPGSEITRTQLTLAATQALTDPHSPAEDRVNGVMRNMPEFVKAFGCSKDSPMAAPVPCRLW